MSPNDSKQLIYSRKADPGQNPIAIHASMDGLPRDDFLKDEQHSPIMCRTCNSKCHRSCGETSPSRRSSIPSDSNSAVWNKDGQSPHRQVPVSPATTKCRACASECDWNCIQCEICGEPFEVIPFERIRKTRKPRSALSVRANSVIAARRSNLTCRECSTVFSSESEVCPICGEHNDKLITTIREEPVRTSDSTRCEVKVRSPSGAAALLASGHARSKRTVSLQKGYGK